MFDELVADLRSSFRSGRSRSIEWRKAQLKAMRRLLEDNAEVFREALKNDLGRSEQEALVLDVFFAIQEIDYALQNMDSWLTPQFTSVPPLTAPVSCSLLTSSHANAGLSMLRLRAIRCLPHHRSLQLPSSPMYVASHRSHRRRQCRCHQAK